MKKLLLFKKQGFKAMLLLGLLLLAANNAFSQTITTFTTSSTWLCPTGVYSVQVECWGAGGGGGGTGKASTSSSNRSGGGGGAGSYVKKTIAVVPGTTYTVTVGAGGTKGGTSAASGYYGGPGGKSEFSGGSIIALTASGGTGGTGAGISNLNSNPGGVLGGVYGFSIGGTKTTNYTPSSVVNLSDGGGTGVTTAFDVGNGIISYIAATNQGTGYTTAPSVAVSIGAGQTFTALVNPNINSIGAETTTLGSSGGASSVSAGGAGGSSPDGLGGTLPGGAGGTGTTVGTTYDGATATNAGAGGGGGFSVFHLSSAATGNGGVGAKGKIVLTYTATIPSISVTPATLSGFSTVPDAPSTAQTFSVSGSLLEADIVITAPTNYEINNPLVDGTYGSSITLTQASGSVAATTINVRLKTGLTGATGYAENISLTTTNGITQTVACSGGVRSYYYYAGSGSLANVVSWSTNANGVGGYQPTNFITNYQVFVIRNTTAVSTDTAWNVAGTGSVIQVGDSAVPGVALTIAGGFDISTTAVLPVVGNGAIDIPAASSGVNSVILQSTATPPAMGIMDANSEVHYQATISTAGSKIFGKMFIENNSTVTFTGKPVIQTILNVATGSTLLLGSGITDYLTINNGATVAIDGYLKSAKAAGLFSYGVTTPGNGLGSIQFKDAVGGLTLGSSSTVEYNRTGSSTAQPISTLPTGVKYNNLTLSDSGVLNNKLFSGAVTVNNTFTLNQSASNVNSCGNLTLADGATIVRTGGSLDAAPVFGTTVNVTYNGATAITSGVEIPTTTSVLNNLTIDNPAGVILNLDTTVNNNLTLGVGSALTIPTGKNLTVDNTIVNNGTITIENNANLVQTAVANTNSGSGTAIVKRNSASIQLFDYTLWSSPVAGQNLKAFSPETLDSRFYTYNSSTNQYNVVNTSLITTPFSPATGYLIRAPNTWAAATPNTFNGVFTGILNNGNQGLSSLIPNQFYATGNPYPSTISAEAFYTENASAGTLYFWRRTNGNISTTAYATLNRAGSTTTSFGLTPSADIAVGQGFIVSPGATTLSFKNAMRSSNTSATFLRTTENRSRFWLNLSSSTGAFCQTMVAYMPEATSGFDNAIDGKYINDAPIALTSIINAEEYTIQGRALPFATLDTVPLGFKTNAAGNYTIAIDHVDGLFSSGQAIYLKDNLLNTVNNLSAGSYSFASAIGTFNSRFEVVYQSTLAETNPTFTANSVIAFSENGEIRINSGSTIMELVRVYDLQGRLLVEKKQINSSETKLSTTATNQVLLLEITAANGLKVTKKIIQ
jgi:hypothetical protein